MTGVVTDRPINGHGRILITGDDGTTYETHTKWINGKIKIGTRVAFEKSEYQPEGMYPWADKVQRAEYQRVTGTGESEWIPLEVPERVMKVKFVRCGYCGEKAVNGWNYCPKCGTKMKKDERVTELAKKVYAEVENNRAL